MQGVGAAAALAGGSAAMAQEFEGRARTRAFSMLGTTFGVGLAFGPIVAGLLIEYLGWRSIFLTSTVVGALALVFGAPRMRETRDPNAAGLDWPGILSFTGALSLFTVSVIQAPAIGWADPLILGLLIGAALLLVAFIYAETHVARPMLDLSLFRFPGFVGVQLLPVATCFAYVVLLILLPLRFIGVEGKSEIEAGFLMIALSAPMLVVPTLAVSLTRWLSAGIISAAGLLIAAAGLLWLGQVTPDDGLAVVAPMLIIGVGAGLPWGLMDGLAVSVVPTERAGMATGIFNTTRVASEGIALAIVSAALSGLVSLHIGRLLHPSEMSAQQLREASQRLATGDLAHAASLLPEAVRPHLIQAYLSSFGGLSWALAAITAASAVACFWFLRSRPSREPNRRDEASSNPSVRYTPAE
jgi:Na+/melibiose symporter-like transporter